MKSKDKNDVEHFFHSWKMFSCRKNICICKNESLEEWKPLEKSFQVGKKMVRREKWNLRVMRMPLKAHSVSVKHNLLPEKKCHGVEKHRPKINSWMKKHPPNQNAVILHPEMFTQKHQSIQVSYKNTNRKFVFAVKNISVGVEFMAMKRNYFMHWIFTTNCSKFRIKDEIEWAKLGGKKKWQNTWKFVEFCFIK